MGLNWNFVEKSGLWILGNPYNIPGAGPVLNKLRKTFPERIELFLSFLQKLFVLSSILKVYLKIDSPISSYFARSDNSYNIFYKYVSLSIRTTPLPLSGLHTIISLLDESWLTSVISCLVNTAENIL